MVRNQWDALPVLFGFKRFRQWCLSEVGLPEEFIVLRFLKSRLNRICVAGVACAFLLVSGSFAQAQVSRGFDRTAQAGVTAVELSRQADYWAMEVQFKPVRLVWVDEVNPTTGEKSRQQIWYLAWRSIVRELPVKEQADDRPVNRLDPLPGPRKFIPQMTLVTYADPTNEIPKQIIQDEIFPAAITQIRQTERDRYLDMVAVVQDLPAPVAADVEDQQWIYGAATWKGVDPDTRFFKIIMAGFTNGYEVRTENAEQPQTWRKVIVQRFHRPGDRFDPNSREFLYVNNPEWVLQPDATPALQNASAE